MVNFGFKEKVKLFISDIFTSTKIIEFDEEARQAQAARKKRLLNTKPPSPFQAPYR